MELVYLWVEDYKNIKKQGFNFSPRFDCKYDEDTKELTIDENEDYVSIFPENINVTAIVGENGSGKSSIVEFLAEIFRIEYNKNKNLIVDDEHTYNFYLVFKMKDKTYEIKRISYIDEHSLEENKKIENILDCHIYSNDKQNIENKIILDNATIAKMLVYTYNKNKDFELSSFMYLPNEIIIELCDFDKKFEKLISNNRLYPMNISEPDSVYIERMGNEINNQCGYFSSLQDKYHQFLIIKLLEKTQSTCDYSLTKQNIIKKLDNKNLIDEENFNLYFSSLEGFHNVKKYNVSNLDKEKKKIYLEEYSDFFEFDFIDNKKRRYSDLSHGEKILFGQFLNIYYNSKISKNKNFLFFFDEPEISLHPNWQKSYIKELVLLLAKIGKNYHFIFTSHSPFLLSDLPKENVIFLEKYKKDEDKNQKVGNCKIANLDINQTFGANIHTLLSHGFFMKDGLMGEFAKDKINDVINFLNGEKSIIQSKKEAINIIKIIGEAFLKEKLLKMYDEKFQISKEERIKQLKKELAELEK
ncbi:AAA family ATPase [Arcobacter sp.]|uniref:AAA family ATPase n=1 Tax=Arcobacter sp. TaxID=1872629 RepID=UPI003C757514